MKNIDLKDTIIFLTTSWGYQDGGINTFNTELCIALNQLIPTLDIICFVAHVEPSALNLLDNDSIKVLRFENAHRQTTLEEYRVYEIKEKLKQLGISSVLCWVGHDVVSGSLANKCAKTIGGKSAVIHHYNYLAYGGFKNKNSNAVLDYSDKQKKVLKDADIRFAVGPKLLRSAEDSLNSEELPNIVQLDPGLSNIHPNKRAMHTFTPLFMGRLSERDDPIKQYRLCLNALAKFNSSDHLKPTQKDINAIFIGYESHEDIAKSRTLLKEKSEALLNFLPISYIENRTKLTEYIRASSCCFMTSFHEGFGLTGWEAIAAGVPLITSKNTGLYDLLEDKLSGRVDFYVHSISVQGSHDEQEINQEDVEALYQTIIKIHQDPQSAKDQALELRRLLLEKGLTWESTAYNFINTILAKTGNIDVSSQLPTGTERKAYEYTWHILSPFCTIVGFKKIESECISLLQEEGYLSVTISNHSDYYKVQITETLSLYWFRFGVAVWHIEEYRVDQNVYEYAVQREKIYESIKNEHEIKKLTDKLLIIIHQTNAAMKPLTSSLHYSYSIVEIKHLNIDAPSENITKLFSFPSLLYSRWNRTSKLSNKNLMKDTLCLEKQYLSGEKTIDETMPFGLKEQLNGFASWSGVAFINDKQHNPALAELFIEYEVATQALWWYFKHMHKLMEENKGRFVLNHNKKYRMLVKYNHHINIDENDCSSLTSFKEAIVATSKLKNIVENYKALLEVIKNE